MMPSFYNKVKKIRISLNSFIYAMRISLHFGGIDALRIYLLLAHCQLTSICALLDGYIHRVQWIDNLAERPTACVGINLCCLRTLVPEQFLDVTQICSTFEEMSCKAVPQTIDCHIFHNACSFICVFED